MDLNETEFLGTTETAVAGHGHAGGEDEPWRGNKWRVLKKHLPAVAGVDCPAGDTTVNPIVKAGDATLVTEHIIEDADGTAFSLQPEYIEEWSGY